MKLSWLVGGFLVAEALSLLGLWLGSRWADRGVLRRVGALSYARKMRALERLWPLTLLPPAIARRDVGTVTAIVTAMVTIKSAGSLVLGLVMIAWLPVASLLVPSIVAAHDPDNPSLRGWARHVAQLQVTSHVAAASLGFAVTLAGPLSGREALAVVRASPVATLAAILVSTGFAVAAGRAEALGLVRHGIGRSA